MNASITISTFEEYLNILDTNHTVAKKQLNGPTLFFRGQSDKSYTLTPSVFRNGLLPKENLLISDMMLNSPNEFVRENEVFEQLVKMQHYGLPTRLIDVTTNPLVALYFACIDGSEDCSGKDGEVLVFYDYMYRPSELDVRCLAALATYCGSSEQKLKEFLESKGFLVSANLERICSIRHLAVLAPQNNERIKRQQGAFILVGINGDDTGNLYQKAVFDLRPFLIKEFEDQITRSIVIPSELKRSLLERLDTLGVHGASLFPELEYQAAYIKAKYMDA